jgi:hypothetical protein
MVPLIFAPGALLSVLAGLALGVRYLRAALADDIGPQLRRLHATRAESSGRCRTSSTPSRRPSILPWPPGTPSQASVPGPQRFLAHPLDQPERQARKRPPTARPAGS